MSIIHTQTMVLPSGLDPARDHCVARRNRRFHYFDNHDKALAAAQHIAEREPDARQTSHQK